MQLDPGDDHPNGPCPPDETARRLGVDAAVVACWTDAGLPVASDGRIDPYVAVSWVSWHRLAECPALARKWRAWLRWFTTPGRACRLAVRRTQTIFLPSPGILRWWVPEPPDAPGQRILGRIWSEGEPEGRHRLIERREAAREHRWEAEDDIELTPTPAEPRDRAWCETLVADLAAAFTYAYRRHRPDEAPAWTGTCLDLARLAGAELERRGRDWRLVSGVVAHRGLANAHFWVEFDDGPAGWVPLDATIPAVARMLVPDWRAAVVPAVGRHDGRRIRVGDSMSPLVQVPGGPQYGSCAGEVAVGDAGALHCTDWAVGECGWSVSAA